VDSLLDCQSFVKAGVLPRVRGRAIGIVVWMVELRKGGCEILSQAGRGLMAGPRTCSFGRVGLGSESISITNASWSSNRHDVVNISCPIWIMRQRWLLEPNSFGGERHQPDSN
jgi:hypothetical protein